MKTILFEIKQLTEEGTFEGLLSPYGNKDNGDDVVEKGAYTKTLKEQGATRPMLWQHKADQPIGNITLEDRADGLWAKGKLLLDLPKAKEAYVLLKAGVVKGLSIGFKSMKEDFKDGVRLLKEIKLYEGSIVTFPMNEMALVTNVKASNGDGPGDFNEELTEVQLWDMPYQLMSALQNCIYELFWSRLPKVDTISGFQTVFAQFQDAYMAFLPNYLDAMNERYGGMEAFSRRIMEIKAAGKTKTVDGEELTAGDFLVVGDPEDTSTWKLPWKFSTDDKTKAHLRNALARFDQLLGVSDADKAKAKKRLISLCEKYGIDVSDDFKKSTTAPEVKKGAKFSAETKGTMMESCKGIQGHVDTLMALLEDEADTAGVTIDEPVTSLTKAADLKPEPAEDHSAIAASIEQIEALLK